MNECEGHYNDAECVERFKRNDEEYQNKIVHWAETRLMKTNGKNNSYSSYNLKHICEKTIDQYVSNDDMKAAMIICGFTSFNENGLNQFYNITKISAKVADSEARAARLIKNRAQRLQKKGW